MLRYLVLGFLRDGNPRHGYALMKAYRAVSDRKISTGNFYRELARLLASGRVETADRAPDRDPRQTPYRITPQGATCFDEWFAAPLRASDAEPIDDLALRLFVLPRTMPDKLVRVLERWKDELWLHAKLLEKSRDHLASRPEIDRVRVHILTRRIGHLSVDIDVIDDILRRVASARSSTAQPQALLTQRRRPLGRPTVTRRTT